ncbi:MAG: HAD-IIIA family hydrolase [Oscillospiraceae bacterium]|nr:HAD-IIIA family hydrolase [Oscillospiraceae bacterium]
MKAVIMAGGKGTRLRELTNDNIPKPLAPVNGKPILQRQIERLIENNIIDICVVIGYLGEKIVDFLGDGSKFAVNVRYYCEATPLGTAGALGEIRDYIGNDDFLLVFGDTIFDIDILRMESFHKSKDALATLFVHPNSHPFDSDLVLVNSDNLLIRFDSKNNIRDYWYKNLVNAGLYILNPSIIAEISGKTDLEKDVLLKEIERGGRVYGYRSAEYIKDAGTIDRIRQVEQDLNFGIVYAKNLSRKQKCIFLDRDGTLNRDMDAEISIESFELLPETAEAIRLINSSGYLAVVVTNQPMVAKGFITFDDLDVIHAKMETLLGKEGAYLDAIYYCPHHPDSGFIGEIPELKINCGCRKPKPGMLLTTAEDFNIDLSESYMIGDSENDVRAAFAAGVTPIKLEQSNNILCAVQEIIKRRN